jgi:hypothetical protein
MKRMFGLTLLVLLAFLANDSPAFGYSPVEIFASVDRIKFVGEQNVVLKTNIVFYQQVNPFWEELSKVNFSPFKLEKVILGERKIFDREKELTRDYREATFLLSLPSSAAIGFHVIPSFSLNYSHFSGKDEIRGAIKSKAIKMEKTPILAVATIDKDVLTIGEPNVLRLTIWRENYIRILNRELKDQKSEMQDPAFERWLKSLEVRGLKITNFNKPDLAEFKLLGEQSRVKQQEPISKEVWEYTFNFDKLGGKDFQVPALHIWYLDESKKEKTREPLEITTLPLVVRINLIVRPERQSFEWLKPPKSEPKNYLYYFGYTPLALGIASFLIFAASALFGLIGPRKETGQKAIIESFSLIYSRLESIIKSPFFGRIERETIIKTRNEIFKLLGSILEIPADQILAKTTPQMLELLEVHGFSKNSLAELKTLLSDFDGQILGETPSPAELNRLVSQILAVKEISRLVRKRKKFIIF